MQTDAIMLDTRVFLIGGGHPLRDMRTGRFLRRASQAEYGSPALIAPPRKASAAFLAASQAHRNRQALIARVAAKSAPDRSLLRKVRVRAGDLYQNPNAGKRDAWGHVSLMPRTRDTARQTAYSLRRAV